MVTAAAMLVLLAEAGAEVVKEGMMAPVAPGEAASPNPL
jgi:hypothetical protein